MIHPDELDELSGHVDTLARSVIPADHLDSFLALDLEARLTGLATFAKLAGEKKVYSATMLALIRLKAAKP